MSAIKNKKLEKDVLYEIHRVKPILGIGCLKFKDYDNNKDGVYSVLFEGKEEYGSNAGKYTFDYPFDILNDEEKRKNYLDNLEKEVKFSKTEKNKKLESAYYSLLESQKLLVEEAEQLLKEANEAYPIDGYKHLHFETIDEDGILFRGEKSVCDYIETYEFYIEPKLLFNQCYREDYLNRRKGIYEEKQKEKEKRIQEQKDRNLELKRRQFEALKKELGKD